uniref:Uncharacterized protein n=1 Tax=Mantoniella antarctica TaxID=81844 RepID=A0A7S0X2J4_9CHLO
MAGAGAKTAPRPSPPWSPNSSPSLSPPPPLVSAANRYGATALHIAALLGSAPLTVALLAAGATHGARDGNGARPIDVAAREGHEKVLVLLRGVQVVGEDEPEQNPRGRRRRNKKKESGAEVQPLDPKP